MSLIHIPTAKQITFAFHSLMHFAPEIPAKIKESCDLELSSAGFVLAAVQEQFRKKKKKEKKEEDERQVIQGFRRCCVSTN